MQVDLQPFVEPEQGSLPSIWITVASSLTLASPRSNSTPFDRRTCNESAINDVSGGSTGETAGTVDGAVTTGQMPAFHSQEHDALGLGCRLIRRLSPAGPVSLVFAAYATDGARSSDATSPD